MGKLGINILVDCRPLKGAKEAVEAQKGDYHFMDEHDTKQFIEAAQATFELKVSDRLRKTEEDAANRVRTVEAKLQTLQQTAFVIAALAVIFGVTGAWGLKLFWGVQTELDKTSRRVAELSTSFNEQVERLQKAGTEQLEQFREDAKREADAALAGFRSEISSMAFSKQLQARSVKIVNAEGRTLISLAAGTAGGLVEIFSTTSGKRITTVGASDDGDGVLSLSNKSGRELLREDTFGSAGNLYLYNAATKQIIANFGGSSEGDGVLWISDRSGRELLRGSTSGGGGTYTFTIQQPSRLSQSLAHQMMVAVVIGCSTRADIWSSVEASRRSVAA